MSTIKSSSENLTLNADGSGNDIKFQSNGVEKASLTDGGVFTATSFAGNGANLTSVNDSTKLPLSGGTMTGNIAHAGAFTIDAGGDIHLDTGGQTKFDKNGTNYGIIFNSSNNLGIHVGAEDKDLVISGNDGGSSITALTLDMSGAGAATFNASIALAGDIYLANNSILRSGGQALIARYDPVIEIGSGDGDDYLKFKAGAAERMRILTNGNVGIGVTDPDSKLEINGNLHVSGNIRGKQDSTTEIGGAFNVGGIKRIHMVQGAELRFGDTTNTNPLGITEGAWNNFGDQDYLSIHFRSKLELYASNGSKRIQIDGDGIKFGGDTAAANALDDYESGTFSPSVSGLNTSVNGSYVKIGDMVTVSGYANITGGTFDAAAFRISGLPFTSNSNGGTNTVGSIMYNAVNITDDYLGLVTYMPESSTNLRVYEQGDMKSFVAMPKNRFSSSSEVYFSIVYRTA